MDDDPPDARSRCPCGRLTVRVTATHLRAVVPLACPSCGWLFLFIPSDRPPA